MLAAPERLSGDARTLLQDPRNDLLLSAASAWEIAIKVGLGKLVFPEPVTATVPEALERSGVTPLPIHHSHALEVAVLPRHHRDPFDRMLVAQARLEGVPILTADPRLGRYDVEVLRG